MAVNTTKRNARQQKWRDENMERHTYFMQIGMKDKVVQAATKAGISYSQYVQRAINNQLIADGFEPLIKTEAETEKDPE